VTGLQLFDATVAKCFRAPMLETDDRLDDDVRERLRVSDRSQLPRLEKGFRIAEIPVSSPTERKVSKNVQAHRSRNLDDLATALMVDRRTDMSDGGTRITEDVRVEASFVFRFAVSPAARIPLERRPGSHRSGRTSARISRWRGVHGGVRPFAIRYYNADGSRATLCGNASLCAAQSAVHWTCVT
jgi:hypothetical protein